MGSAERGWRVCAAYYEAVDFIMIYEERGMGGGVGDGQFWILYLLRMAVSYCLAAHCHERPIAIVNLVWKRHQSIKQSLM
jgi:hypothetical protein